MDKSGVSPEELMRDGAMAVPPWEFFPRVFPDHVFAEGVRDTPPLRRAASSFGWRSVEGGLVPTLVYASRLARRVKQSDDSITSFVAGLVVLSDVGALSWDGSYVRKTLPRAFSQR